MDEKGMIAVETLIAFIGFIMLMATVIFFVNLAAVQSRVHYALTQTAKEVSVYSYLFELTGVTAALDSLGGYAEPSKEELNGVLENLNGLTGNDFNSLDDFNDAVDSVEAIAKQAKAWADNPKDFFTGMMWVALEKGADMGMDALFGYVIAPALFDKYMKVGSTSTERYFKNMGISMDGYNRSDVKKSVTFIKLGWDWSVDGSGLQGSHFLTESRGEITVKVEYYADFGVLNILPKDFRKLKIVQQVKTKAWVGDGERYKN